jgi:hypothetical protein
MKSPLAPALLASLVLAGTAFSQTQVTLTESSAIGGSPVFFNSGYNVGAYAAGNLFDQQSGLVDMSTQPNFAWFPYEGTGITNRFVTIDLGAAYVLSSITIFNSSQADRGTGNFSLSASNSVTTGLVDGGHSTGFALVSPSFLINSTALTFSTANVVTGQSFSISNGNAYRYLQLTAIDMQSGGGFTAPGLAEVRIYSAIPEPSTYALLAGGAGLALAMMRRRRAGPGAAR